MQAPCGCFLVPSGTCLSIAYVPYPGSVSCTPGFTNGSGVCTNPLALSNPGATTPEAPKLNDDGCRGMCAANAHTMLVSLNLNDIPVGYQPPLGPAVFFQLSYSHKEAGQPASFNYGNVGAKWTHNFLAYIEDDTANPGQNVKRVVGGGGYVVPTGYSAGTFAREKQSLAVLSRTPATGTATSYTLSYPDGSSQTYAKTATGTPHRLFLSAITDAQGKSLTLAYDGSNRLTKITDATGRETTFSYTHSNPLLITKVTDPFGRFATLAYGTGAEAGKLTGITDVLGITSTVAYATTGDTSFVSTLTTPYGTSSFSGGSDYATNYRWLELTDPLGGTERLEFKQNAPGVADAPANVPDGITAATGSYSKFNTFHWNSHVKATFGTTDYSKAQRWHWLTNEQGQTSPILGMVKPALDNPTYLNYPGQTQPYAEGTLGVPSAVGRKPDATTSQVTQYAYNALGKPTSVTDPLGRVSTVAYDGTGVDPVTLQQKTSATGYSTVGTFFNYSAHLPGSYTDAAGQTWQTGYTADKQLYSLTNPAGQYTQFFYDAYKRLETVKNTNNAVVRTYHYPCATSTSGTVNCNLPDWIKDFDGVDAAGYQRSFTYDKFDRVTQITYPDGTTEKFSYSFPAGWPNQGCVQCPVPTQVIPSLDLFKYTDRQGRETDYDYDRNRRRIAVSETVTVNGVATTRTTKFRYYANGALQELEDANGNVTRWNIDEQSRPVGKTYAYGTVAAKSESYTYDLAGRLKTVTDALGQVKTIAYNADNSPASYSYTKPVTVPPLPDTANVSFTYDEFFPRLKTMTDMSGLNGTTGQPAPATTTFAYGALGTNGALRLQSETSSAYYNQHAAFYYDSRGRLTNRWAAESEETFGYDALDRLTSYGTPLGTFSIGYLGQSGLPTSRSVTNGTVTLSQTYGYDTTANDRRLKTITANTSAVRSYTYGYGYTENSIAKTDRYNIRTIAETATSHPLGAQSWVYGYDQGDRLMSAAATAVAGSGASSYGTYSWGYDKLDNAKPITYPASEWGGYTDNPEYNALNQQTKNAWWQGFTYDAAGNATAEVDLDNASAPLRQYSYDMEGRLLTMTDPNATGGHTVRFHYDGMGRRILQKTTSNGTTTYKRYLWCGQTICQQRDTGTNPLRRYLATGEYVNAIGGNPAKKYLYFQDHLGSVRDLVDATTGARVGALDYKPYGAVKASTGVLPDYQYAGLLWVPEVGLNASATRFYDPGTTRWMTADWIGELGGINRYGYNGGNPVMRVYPLGQAAPLGLAYLVGQALAGFGAIYATSVWSQIAANGGDVGAVNGQEAMAWGRMGAEMMVGGMPLMTTIPARTVVAATEAGGMCEVGGAFASTDPLVGSLATKIDAAYPGHVLGVNVPVRDAAGKLITDADILLKNGIVQVKSGGGKGLTSQLQRTEQATGLPTIGYGPDLKPSILRGCAATNCEATLIEVVKP